MHQKKQEHENHIKKEHEAKPMKEVMGLRAKIGKHAHKKHK